MRICIATNALMPSPIHFRYAISSTNAAAVAQKNTTAKPSKAPGAIEPPGAGCAHAALNRELHCAHFIRKSQLPLAGNHKSQRNRFPGPPSHPGSKDRFGNEQDRVLVCLMVNTVKHWHLPEVTRIYAFQAGNVKAKLVRIGAPLVMRIDAANGDTPHIGTAVV